MQQNLSEMFSKLCLKLVISSFSNITEEKHDFCFIFRPDSIRKIRGNFLVMALERLVDMYHVHSDSSVILIYCIRVQFPIATGIILS